MLNFFKVVTCFLLVLFGSNSHASLIKANEDMLSDDLFVSIGGYDWVWASAINVQFYRCDPDTDSDFTNYDQYLNINYEGAACSGPNQHQLLAPTFHQGWSFYEDLFDNGQTLEEYLSQITNQQFTDIMDVFFDGSRAIQAFSYWNTNIDGANYSKSNPLQSQWIEKGRSAVDPFSDRSIYANTIYVRESQPVPEPSSLFIFTIALFLIVFRLKRTIEK